MGDESTSAVKRYDATVDVPGCDCCSPSVEFNEYENGDWVKIKDHVAAVEAERRKAAADALRKAASGANRILTFDDEEVMAVTQDELLALADRIEKGET